MTMDYRTYLRYDDSSSSSGQNSLYGLRTKSCEATSALEKLRSSKVNWLKRPKGEQKSLESGTYGTKCLFQRRCIPQNVIDNQQKINSESIEQLVQSLLPDDCFPIDKKPITLYEDGSDDYIEIGLVDWKVPDLKGLSFVVSQTKISIADLYRCCTLLNRPGQIGLSDYQGLKTFINCLNELKNDVSNRIVSNLKKQSLLTDIGVKNVFQLLSCNDNGFIHFFKREVIKSNSVGKNGKKINIEKVNKFSNAPFNETCLPSLSYILDKVRIKRPLTDEEENRLVTFIRDLLKLPNKHLESNFKKALKKYSLSKNQLETLVELLPCYGRTKIATSTLMKGNTLSNETCNDLANLISQWPHLQVGEMKRLEMYVKDLSSMDHSICKDCLNLMKSNGYLNNSMIKFLKSTIKQRNFSYKTRLLIL